jgi:hypothetical protein
MEVPHYSLQKFLKEIMEDIRSSHGESQNPKDKLIREFWETFRKEIKRPPTKEELIDNLVNTVKSIGMELKNRIISLDAGYSSKKNRKSIFNLGMKPNIPENKRNSKKPKRGRKQMFDEKIFKERFRTIERVFALEDKFKRLLLRFEIKSIHHYAMKTIAYSMINMRHICG